MVEITSFSQVPAAAKAEEQAQGAAPVLRAEAGLDVVPEPDVEPGQDAVSVRESGPDEAVSRSRLTGEDAEGDSTRHCVTVFDAPDDANPVYVNVHLRQ
jgi:hypothetical protein